MKQTILLLSIFFTTIEIHADVRAITQLEFGIGQKETIDIAGIFKQEIEAGTGIGADIGIEFDNTVELENWKTQLLLGYKVNAISTSNVSIDISRVTLSAIELYDFSAVELGLGVTYHFSPTLKGDGFLKVLEIDLENAFGAIFQVGYRLNSQATLGVKAVLINYEEPFFHSDIKGSSVGIFASYRF